MNILQIAALTSACFVVVVSMEAKDKKEAVITEVNLSGYVSERIDACIECRVKAQDVDHLVYPFTLKNETHRWQSEFWGKWILGAINSYRYNKDPELYDIIKYAVGEILKTQLDNGYIGNYSDEAQLQQWDVWGRKYTLLGLLAYYDLSGDKKALDAGSRMVDHLMTQVGPGKQDIVKTGNYRGMPSSSILEPLMFLYDRTKKQKYLDFANYIVTQWETPDGPKLISKALENVSVSERFPYPKTWWSWENGHKAYEMMSCYEGLIELYKETGEPRYLEAVEKSISNIIAEEITEAGSGSAFECWYGGRAKQTVPTYHTMETCVTFTWMKLCNTLLALTGNPMYADQIEKTTYNALLAALKDDASQIVKYSPLEGRRTAGEEQCDMHINCCNANGPRAFALIPQFAYQVRDGGLVVNFYNPSQVTVQLSKKQNIKLTQATDYPVTGKIEITVEPSKEVEYPVSLRIPAWSRTVQLTVNGEAVPDARSGNYCTINRLWKKGDKIELTLDMRAHVVELNNMQAILRGPVLLARDSRFRDGDVDEAAVIYQKDGYVELTPVTDRPSFAWMAFTAPVVLGTDLEGGTDGKQVKFCNFSSAGNDWSPQERYRVWIPKTLNVMNTDYTRY